MKINSVNNRNIDELKFCKLAAMTSLKKLHDIGIATVACIFICID